LIAHPTTSHLIPYTTLFRSKAELKAVQDKILTAVENATTSPEKLMELMLFVGKYEKRYLFNNRWLLASQGARVVDSYKGWQNRGDRKSTRLNSSHVSISYAV